MKRIWLLLLLGLCLSLSSCVEIEMDIDLKRDGSGEMRMKILPLEKSMNPFIDELESDLRKQDKDSEVTKKVETDGRVSLFVRKKFQRVEEAAENCKFVSLKDHDEFTMDVSTDFMEIIKKVKVTMPGRIFESNVKNYKGRSLTWDRTSSSANRLIIKSKPSGPIGDPNLIVLIIILCVGTVAAILIFKKINKKKASLKEVSFCSECGAKANPEDNFCQECGHNLR